MDVAHEANARSFDPGTRAILAELRDLRRDMRAERQERRRADEERQQRSDERFDRLMRELHADTERIVREFREDSVRRDAVTQKAFAGIQHAFKDVHAVGLSIVKTLNRHTQILTRIDRKLGVRGNGRSGPENGRPK